MTRPMDSRRSSRRKSADLLLNPSAEILDAAFHRASLVTPRGPTKAARDRLRAELKVVRSSATVVRHLRLEARPLLRPPLSEFEVSLLHAAFGEGVPERALVRVRRAEDRIRRLARDAERGIHQASGSEELGDRVRAFYGRLASFVQEIDADLLRLRETVRFLKERPHLEPNAPTLVVAGFPNVGKSSLVARLSTAHPRIADYPFTTRSIAVGHADLGFDRLQVVDTPGVLGRPDRANPAEVEATTTVRGAATLVLFVIDPTELAEHSVAEQEALLARWREEYPQLPMVVVDTKCDISRRSTDHLRVSAVTGEGIDELWKAIRGLVRPKEEMPPMEEEIVEGSLAEPPDPSDTSVTSRRTSSRGNRRRAR